MKTRFCPSPTGYMHLGNIRTALFNALLAKGQQGNFLLRIEDTDKIRSGDEYAEMLQHDLHWLGLKWQEGPGVEGPQAPYWQSQRQEIYQKYYEQLEKQGLVYPCFCTDQQLAISRKVQLAAGHPPRYSGTCVGLTAEQIAQKKAEGIPATLRFKVPEDGYEVCFTDLVHGPQSFKGKDIGDFIIRRADGTASFIFCNAIDDALMGVTHALRGMDHLTNTPRQLLILEALKLPAPQYGHISLIVGSDGSPLSKRHGSRSIYELREEGFLPIALVNYLARLGHYYTDPGFMDFETLAKNFNTDTLGTAPARFDAVQLLHWQKEAVARTEHEVLWEWMGSAVHQIVPENQKDAFIETVRHNITFPADALRWAKNFFEEEAHTTEAIEAIREAGSDFFLTALKLLDTTTTDFKALSQGLQQSLNVKGKALFQPLRAALTGEISGPEMAPVLPLLGIERIRSRLQHATHL